MTTSLEREGVTAQETEEAFRIETRGVDYIPVSERWASPRAVGSMWAGASVQIEYFFYGAILMTFGFSFVQAISLIIIGNLSFFFLGLASLQGPQTGTTTFGTNRAAFGPNGSRGIAFFNWITQMGFEVEGIILIAGAGIVLATKAGFAPGRPAEVIFVIIAVLIQGILPVLGHSTMIKVLRWLTIPFVVLFAVVLGFALPHATGGAVHGANWKTYMAGLAFTITLSGLGWTENGNDYTRYCKPTAKKSSIVGWIFLCTAVPEILVMLLGASVGTFLTKLGTGTTAFLPFAHQHFFPAPFVVIFLIFAILQIFAINSLDLYSSGVTLLAVGLKTKRYVAVLIDCAIVLIFSLVFILNASFSTFLKDFVDIVIIWIAPWFGIYVTDWILRKFRYVPQELQKTGRDSLYYRHGGIHWPAWIAQIVGMFAAVSALSATFSLPTWLNELTQSTINPLTKFTFGADFSIYLGIGIGAIVYLVLSGVSVRKEAAKQEQMFAAGVPAE